jgi:hypothetical protein
MESSRRPPTVLDPNRIDPVSLDSKGGSSQILVAAGFCLAQALAIAANRTAPHSPHKGTDRMSL